MTSLLVIRHGPTAWNADRRLQGHSDQPLSDEGRAVVGRWSLPNGFEGARWFSSPLQRARQTAALLGHPEAEVEPALIEMDWGAWEGQTLAALRQRLGEDLQTREVQGLDFRPYGGESPREVQARLRPWLQRIGTAGRPVVAVCHKGVMRALYALARGWDMTGRPPEKLRDGHAQGFAVDAEGGIAIARLNLPLAP